MKNALTAALILFAAFGCQGAAKLPDARSATKPAAPGRAWIGAALRAPSSSETEAMELPVEVRLQGRAVESVVAAGPAAIAGLKSGDVLLCLDENELYSHDDLADFLRASRPGENIELTVRRAGTTQDELVTLELANSPDLTAQAPSIDWEFASLAQLSQATIRAKNEKRRLLIGLSGAET